MQTSGKDEILQLPLIQFADASAEFQDTQSEMDKRELYLTEEWVAVNLKEAVKSAVKHSNERSLSVDTPQSDGIEVALEEL